MSKTNYSKMSNKQKEVESTVTSGVSTSEASIAEEPVVSKIKKGKVVCKNRLNIRKNPSLSAEIIGTLSNGQKVEVLLNEAPIDKEWSFVVGETGIEGYCMMQYLAME